MNGWWVISIGIAGGIFLIVGLFSAAFVLRRNTLRSAMEKEKLQEENERRLTDLLQRATTMGEELKAMSRELLNVQEDERRKISRELHDEVGQLLAAMTVNLELMKKGLQPSDEKFLREKIGDTEKLAAEMFGRIRTVLNELRPAGLDHLGLAVVTRRLLHDFSKRTNIEVETSGQFDALNQLDGDKRIVVFRLIQECLTNVVKHANATIIRVDVQSENGFVSLDISDNGNGFDAGRSGTDGSKRGGMGILGMRERMGLVGGEFRMESTPMTGARVRAKVPVAGRPGGASSGLEYKRNGDDRE